MNKKLANKISKAIHGHSRIVDIEKSQAKTNKVIEHDRLQEELNESIEQLKENAQTKK